MSRWNFLSTSFPRPGGKPGFWFTWIAYLIFVALMLGKLNLLDHELNLPYIDMSGIDFLIAAGCLLVLTFWILWLPSRGVLWALALMNFLLSFVIFADLVYFRYFGDFLTIPVLLQAGQVESLGGSIGELLHWRDLWFFADFPLMLIGALWSWSRRRKAKSGSGYSIDYSVNHSAQRGSRFRVFLTRRLPAGLLILIIGFSAAFFPIRHASQTWAKNLLENNWWNVSMYNVTGLLGFHLIDSYRYVQTEINKGQPLPEERLSEIRDWFQDHQAARSSSAELLGAYKGSNVVTVQGEAFMNFFVGKKIDGQAITPNLDALREDSLYFDHFYHQTGQGRTSDADLATNISLHPLPSGSVFIRYANNAFDTMSSILKKEGYTSSVFHAYDGSFWNRNRMYQEMGYDHFYTEKEFKIDEPLGWSLGDRSFLNQSVGYMEQMPEPFYSFLITLSSHHPYNLDLPEEDKLPVGEFENTVFGDYLQSVHYLDSALGDMIERLKKDGLWENTIFVFYGDHDFSLDERESVSKLLEKPVSEFEYSQMMGQVPLLIHLPDGKLAGTYSQPGGQLDTMPTLLNLLGIDAGKYPLMGRNLLNQSDSNSLVVLRTGAFADGQIYYEPSADGVFENGICYDLNTGQPTDVEKARAGYEEAVKRLSISDDVIAKDLIPVLNESK
ncbi:LTA synthase family protein [Saccharibacillus sp. JS10]|uniref:LTA synthase family protein n=1 Tax=Saccharibacillus sp. JS10 TaxID=2950552 RepID=UPI00210D255F|nr:LTA synthase family protein [Saccharibacillus sp. JS10]MCQ4086978.1 LTA synthase family protein [Saccharibacillus sp. JS10]